MTRFNSIDDLPPMHRAAALDQMTAGKERKSRPSKYRNKSVMIDGIRFSSILEGAYYLQLMREQALGEVSYFLMQVPLRLSSDTTYRVDFQVFRPDNSVEYVDTKGTETKEFKVKRAWVEQKYPISLVLVTRDQVHKEYLRTASDLAGLQAVKRD